MDVMKLQGHSLDSVPNASAGPFEDLDLCSFHINLEEVNPVHAALVQSLLEANAFNLSADADRVLVFKQGTHAGLSCLLEVSDSRSIRNSERVNRNMLVQIVNPDVLLQPISRFLGWLETMNPDPGCPPLQVDRKRTDVRP